MLPPRAKDLGDNMQCIGRLFRHFNDSIPDYDDDFVMNWLSDRNENLDYYNDYSVVIPKVDYARKALSRYDRCEDPYDDEVKALYDIAGDWLFNEFGPYMCDSRVVSNDAVEQHLRWDKSPGAPWTNIGIQSKGEYFEKCADFYAHYWDVLATPDYIRSLCSSSIKEELRTTVKVSSGQVRTIISMDVNHVKAHCQLTLDQNTRLMRSLGKHSSCLGIEMQHGGWDEQNDRMSAYGPQPCTLELDAKQFDSRFRYLQHVKIRNFRFRCLAIEFRTQQSFDRFRNLYRELGFAPFVDVDGHVYLRCVGNPSGQACTTPDNIFKNFMDIVVLWHLIMPKAYHNWSDFKRLLIMSIVGDDINISVHPSIQHLFNMEKIFQCMHRIDMEYTTPCMYFRHNYDCEFLSHGYENVDGRYLPTIDCKKMRTSMLRFNTSGELSETILRANGLRAETFACEYCREWFSDLIDSLRLRCGDSKDPTILSAWRSYKTDAELWSLYTGLKYSDVQAAIASVARSPEYKFKTPKHINSDYRFPQSLSPQMSSMLQVAAESAKKAIAAKAQKRPKKNRNKNKQATKVAVVTTNAPKQKRRRGGKAQNRVQQHKNMVLTELAMKSIDLKDAQHMYCAAVKDAFHKRIPPLEHNRSAVIPLNSECSGSYANVAGASPGYGWWILVPSMSVKSQVTGWYTDSRTSPFGGAGGTDGDNRGDIDDKFSMIRVGLSAIEVRLSQRSDALPARLWVGRIADPNYAITGKTPAQLLRLGVCEEVKSEYAYVCNTPYSTNDGSVLFKSGPITTGASANSYPFIMVGEMSYASVTADTKVRADWRSVVQYEGVPKDTFTVFGSPPVANEHASWSISDILETVTDFAWRSKEVYEGVSPEIKTMVGTAAARYLTSKPAMRMLRFSTTASVEETSITVLFRTIPTTFTYSQAVRIFEDRAGYEFLLDGITQEDRERFDAFVAPSIRHLHDDEKHNAGVVSLESTPEQVARNIPHISDSTMNLAEALRGLVSKTKPSSSN